MAKRNSIDELPIPADDDSTADDSASLTATAVADRPTSIMDEKRGGGGFSDILAELEAESREYAQASAEELVRIRRRSAQCVSRVVAGTATITERADLKYFVQEGYVSLAWLTELQTHAQHIWNHRGRIMAPEEFTRLSAEAAHDVAEARRRLAEAEEHLKQCVARRLGLGHEYRDGLDQVRRALLAVSADVPAEVFVAELQVPSHPDLAQAVFVRPPYPEPDREFPSNP